MNIGEEIRATRSRLELDSANINLLTNEVRQKTRKLEDDQRLTVSFIVKLVSIERLVTLVTNCHMDRACMSFRATLFENNKKQ